MPKWFLTARMRCYTNLWFKLKHKLCKNQTNIIYQSINLTFSKLTISKKMSKSQDIVGKLYF